jgi:hypothetical protein
MPRIPSDDRQHFLQNFSVLNLYLPMIAIYSRHVLGIVGNVLALLYSLAHMRFCLAHDAPVWYSLVRA